MLRPGSRQGKTLPRQAIGILQKANSNDWSWEKSWLVWMAALVCVSCGILIFGFFFPFILLLRPPLSSIHPRVLVIVFWFHSPSAERFGRRRTWGMMGTLRGWDGFYFCFCCLFSFMCELVCFCLLPRFYTWFWEYCVSISDAIGSSLMIQKEWKSLWYFLPFLHFFVSLSKCRIMYFVCLSSSRGLPLLFQGVLVDYMVA